LLQAKVCCRLLRPLGLQLPLAPVWGYSVTAPVNHVDGQLPMAPRAALMDERRDILSGVMRYLNHWLVFKAPPEHTRLRRLLNTVISPATVAEMGPAIRSAFDHIMQGLDPSQEMDFMKEVAELFPAFVILDMLGVPRQDFRAIKGWSDDLRLFIGTAQGEGDKYRRARDGADHMSAYFREIIALRRREPGSDAISRMVAARDDGGMLSEDELVGCCMLFLFGGHETTTNLLGSAVVALLKHPDQLERLHAEPALIDALQSGRLAGAGLDTYAVEPPDAANPLFKMQNVIVTPHIAAATTDAMARMGTIAADNILAWMDGRVHDPRNFLNPEVRAGV
jgi:cytochrome P450